MESALSFITQNKMNILLCTAALLTLVLIILIKKAFAEGAKNKELKQAAADKIRDENLNHVILNVRQEKEKLKEIYKPYDVNYSRVNEDSGKKSRKGDWEDGQLMIQLIERTELSTRKFVLNPAKIIRIGSDLQSNDIVVFSENISPRQCEIFSAMDKVFIRNVGNKCQTVIRRKKTQAVADERGIRLLTGDVVALSGVTYDITLI